MMTAVSVDHNGFCFNCPQCNEYICAEWPANGERVDPCPACGASLHIAASAHISTVEKEEQPWTHDFMVLQSKVAELTEKLSILEDQYRNHTHHIHSEQGGTYGPTIPS